jgi:indolepyruvate ferredoxin oxidoreductase
MATRHDPSLLFTQEEGWLQLGGIQALVRLPLDQIRADRRRGLSAAMFIAGYRGSPVGGLDQAFLAQHKLLKSHDIVFSNGLNEDLAATAVWGTQMLHSVGKQKFDAVLGTWYGKAPGVDRSGDALKHGNYTGIQKNGAVLAIFGDDPSCKSSSLTSQSEPGLWHWGIPSLYPGNQQDILDFGLHGYMLSRVSGCWIGLKIVTNVADGTGSAEVSVDRVKPIIPVVELDGKPYVPHMNLGMNVRGDALEMEYTLYNARHEMARRYARANNLNREVIANPSAWLGIITAGKTYHDVRQAFMEMGMPTEDDIRRAGIRLLKMGMLFPMEPNGVREFAQGLEEIFVIEEKRPFLEMFAKELLYGRASAPRIVGKFDEEEKPLLPQHGELEPDIIGRALTRRLSRKTKLESAEGVDTPPGRDSRPLEGGHAGAARLVLLGLPAQFLDQAAAGQHRVGGHRLPHDGDVDGPQRRDGHPHGRRRRAVDRHGAVHRRAAHLPEHGRRDVLPLRAAGAQLRRRLTGEHHLQDPLQLAHVDDGRPGVHGRPHGAGPREGRARVRREQGHRHHRGHEALRQRGASR